MLDQRQNRGMVNHGMRNILGLRERRNCKKRHSHAKLVKRAATGRIRACGVLRQCRAELLGILNARVSIIVIRRAFGTSAWLLTGRRVREILALTGINSVWIPLSGLDRPRRQAMIVEATPFIPADEDNRVFPIRSVA